MSMFRTTSTLLAFSAALLTATACSGEDQVAADIPLGTSSAVPTPPQPLPPLPVAPAPAAPATPEPADGKSIVIDLVAGEPTARLGPTIKVDKGERVTVTVTSDAAYGVHVHGYDVVVPAKTGATATKTFIADLAGIFEVEVEETGTFLFNLQVS
ncbi:MAG: hypothetical protein ACT4P1_10920 [Sporichthyaceae bacterium]